MDEVGGILDEGGVMRVECMQDAVEDSCHGERETVCYLAVSVRFHAWWIGFAGVKELCFRQACAHGLADCSELLITRLHLWEVEGRMSNVIWNPGKTSYHRHAFAHIFVVALLSPF